MTFIRSVIGVLYEVCKRHKVSNVEGLTKEQYDKFILKGI